MNETLFDLSEPHKNKYEPEPMSKQERLRKQSKRTDPITSHQAAERASRSFGKHKQHVMDLFERAGYRGLTDYELEQQSELRATAAQKRRSDLARDGFLVWNGEFRETDTGSKAKVWIILDNTVNPM